MCTPARATSMTAPLEVDLAVVTISPTIELQSRWPYKLQNSYTKEILTLLKSSKTSHTVPNLGIWQKDWEPPGNLTLEASGIWLKNLNRTGETDSWRAQTKPCAHQEPGERNSVPTRDWARLTCECPGVSRGVSQQWLAAGSQALNTTVRAQVLLKEVTITIITPTVVWPQVKQKGGKHSPPPQQKN